MLVNDNYQFFSNEDCRISLAIYGKKAIFDIVSQPLLDEMLNQRRIIPEKNIALQNAICKTEMAHPSTSATRIAKLIKDYKESGIINSQLFSRAGRGEFEMQFTSSRDMEDILGLICNAYANNMEPRQYCGNSKIYENDISKILVPIINSNGIDYFRENLIRVILYNDYSGFTNEKHINSVKSISIDELLKDISASYIQNAKLIEDNKRNTFAYAPSVEPADIVPICVEQKKTEFREILDDLIEQEREQETKQEDYKYNYY